MVFTFCVRAEACLALRVGTEVDEQYKPIRSISVRALCPCTFICM